MGSIAFKAALTCGVFVVVCASAQGKATGPDEYDGGIEALAAQDFRGASESFQSVLEYAPSAAAYHGFAEASLNLGDLSAATWALRNAELLGGTPNLGQLERRAYANLASDLIPLPISGIDRLAARTNGLSFPNLAALLALLSAAALTGLLVRQVTHRRDEAFGTPWPAILLSLAIGVLGLWVAFRQNELVHRTEAVVFGIDSAPTSDTLSLRTAPSAGAPTERPLPLGTVVTTGETLSGFTQVVLPTGEQGWLPTNRLWPIRPLAPTWPQPPR